MKFRRLFTLKKSSKVKNTKSKRGALGPQELQKAQAELEATRLLFWKERVKSHPAVKRCVRSPKKMYRLHAYDSSRVPIVTKTLPTISRNVPALSHTLQSEVVIPHVKNSINSQDFKSRVSASLTSKSSFASPSSTPITLAGQVSEPQVKQKPDISPPSRPLPPTPVASSFESINEDKITTQHNSWASELSSFAFMGDIADLEWDTQDEPVTSPTREMFSIKRNSQLNVMERISEERERPGFVDASSIYGSSCSSFVSATSTLKFPRDMDGDKSNSEADIVDYNDPTTDWRVLAKHLYSMTASNPTNWQADVSSPEKQDIGNSQARSDYVGSQTPASVAILQNVQDVFVARNPLSMEIVSNILQHMPLPDLWRSVRLVSRLWKCIAEEVLHSNRFVDQFCSSHLKEVRMKGHLHDMKTTISGSSITEVQSFCRTECVSVVGYRALLKIIPTHDTNAARFSSRADQYAGLSFRSDRRWAETSGNMADEDLMTITVDLDKTYRILSHAVT